ncbi:MAG: glycosyltransferase family 4 protein, partial [Planctomycetota bacterium]
SILMQYLNCIDYIIFLSRNTSQILAKNIKNYRQKVIPLGLQDYWFDSPKPPLSDSKSPEDLTIGYAGALANHKAPHLLLDAIRQLGWNGTRIRLAGPDSEPTYRRLLEKKAQGLNVEFVGPVEPDKIPAFLQTIDIFAMTSTCLENYPYAVLEAHATGIPVVGSKVGGIPEQLNNEERLMFEPGSVQGLANALDFVRCNPDRIQIPKVTTIDQMTDQTEDVYRQAMTANIGS